MFVNYYGKLQSILPVKSLSGHFVSEQIIQFDEEEIIQNTDGQTQAASIVLRKVGNSLQAGQTESFDKLLTIMKGHGGLSCEKLANEMRKEILENTSGTVIIT